MHVGDLPSPSLARTGRASLSEIRSMRCLEAIRRTARVVPCWPLLALLALAATFAIPVHEPVALAAPREDTSTADVDGPYLFADEGGGWTSKRVVKKAQGAA